MAELNMAGLNVPEITTIIKRDYDNSRELKYLLEVEQEALIKRDYASINELMEQKKHLLVALDENALQRTRITKEYCPANANCREAWETLLAEINNPKLLQLWQKCQGQITECREQNNINGRLINRAGQAVSKLLNILKGQQDSPVLYDQHGTAKPGPSSRSAIQV